MKFQKSFKFTYKKAGLLLAILVAFLPKMASSQEVEEDPKKTEK